MISNIFLLASFTAPVNIPTDPYSFIWMIPLAAAISIVYKATKLPSIETVSFIRETVVLFASILVFLAISGLILCAIDWLILQ